MGVAPLEETSEIYQAVLENKLDIPVAIQPASEVVPGQNVHVEVAPKFRTQKLPFVRRERELHRLHQAYAELSSQMLDGLIVVEGEAGIGKTRLLETFATAVIERGTKIITTTCYESEMGIAYVPFIRVIRSTALDSLPAWFDQIPPLVWGIGTATA